MCKKFLISLILLLTVVDVNANDVVKIIVTSGPGTPMDTIARAISASDSVKKLLGNTPVVLNKLGASGMVPVAEVAGARPDGNTLIITNATTFGTIPVLVEDIKYDPLKSFDHINIMAATPRGLVVHGDFPADNFEEFVRVLKQNPNKFNFGGIVRSTNDLDMQNLSKTLKFKYEWIGYQSSTHILPDFLSGRIHGAIVQIGTVLPYIKTGQLKIIAVTWEKRLPDFPNTPTWAELGYPMLNTPSWYGIAVPNGTPAETIKKINDAVSRALNEPEVQVRLASGYNFPLNYGPEKATKFVKTGLLSTRRQAEQVGLIK
jgi:tripartite-type tricarboxylate transporter receptor subunit TctC